MKKTTPKRLIASMLAIIFIVSAFTAVTLTANAWSNLPDELKAQLKYTDDGWGYLDNNNKTRIRDYKGAETTATMPTKINGTYVSEIALPVDCIIKNLNIPNTPNLVIAEDSLGQMENLETVTFSRDYTNVNTSPRFSMGAFKDSKKLKSVIMPNLARGRTIYSEDSLCDTFAGCSQLEEVVFPTNTKKFEFSGYTNGINDMLGVKDPNVDHFFFSEGVETIEVSFGSNYKNAQDYLNMRDLKIVLPSTATNKVLLGTATLATIICPTLDVKQKVIQNTFINSEDNGETEQVIHKTTEASFIPNKMATLKVINIDTTLKKLFGDKEYFDKLTADNLVSYKIYDTDNNFVMDYPLEKTSTSIINMYKTLTTGANYNLVLTDKNGDEYTRMFTYYLDGVVPVNETINNTNFETTINTLFDGINTDTITSVKVCDALSDTELAQLNTDGTFTKELESDTVYKIIVTDTNSQTQEAYFKLEDGQIIKTEKPVIEDITPKVSPETLIIDENNCNNTNTLTTVNVARNGFKISKWLIRYNNKEYEQTYNNPNLRYVVTDQNYELPVYIQYLNTTESDKNTCDVYPVYKGKVDIIAVLSNGQKIICHVTNTIDTQDYLNWLAAQQTQQTEPAASDTEPTDPASEPTNPVDKPVTDPTDPVEPVTEPTVAPATEPTENTKTNITIDAKTAKTKTIKKTYGAGKDFTIKYKNLGKITPKYTTTNKKIVSVTKTGHIVCRTKGTATVTVKLDTIKLKYKITVTSNPSAKIGKKAFKSTATYAISKNKTFTFTVKGKAKTVNNKYATTNAKIVKVTSKTTATAIKIKALKKGKATITIKVNGYKTFKIKIKVK